MFFTTTLQNVVQRYSLKQSKLLDPSYGHPSPPTVFTLSCSSHLLLSVSSFPPTIHLKNLTIDSPPISLHPQCSTSTVVAANFHPERTSVFVLAFADGTCVLYDAAYFFRDGGKGELRSGPAGSGAGGEVAHVKQTHAIINSSSTIKLNAQISNYSAETSAAPTGDKSLCITAVALVPGRKAKAVTVGADGKCCVIDFGSSDREARILDSWHIQGPATSLSLLSVPASNVPGLSKAPARIDAQRIIRRDILVAIGRQDGKVMIFDIRGNLLEIGQFDPEGSRVIDVEWTHGDDNVIKRAESDYVVPRTPTGNGKKSARSDYAHGRSFAEDVSAANNTKDHSKVPHTLPYNERKTGQLMFETHPIASAPNHMGLSSAKPLIELAGQYNRPSTQGEGAASSQVSLKKEENSQTKVETSILSSEIQAMKDSGTSSHDPSVNRNQPPRLPTRSAPRRRRHPSMYRPEKQNSTRLSIVDTNPPLIDQAMEASNSRSGKPPILFTPYSKLHTPPVSTELPIPNNDKSTKDKFVGEASFTKAVEEEVWADIASVPQRQRRKVPHGVSLKNSKRRSHYKPLPHLASKYTPSEESNDTVIEWSAASAQIAKTNSLLPRPLSISSRKLDQQPKQQNHPILSQSPPSDDPLVQWHSFRVRPKFNIRPDDPNSSAQASSRYSPKTLDAPLTAQPLTETTHNTKTASMSPATEPTKPPSPPTIVSEPDPPLPLPSTSTTHDIHIPLSALHAELEAQFRAQRIWLESEFQKLDMGRKSVDEENSRVRKGLKRGRER